MFRFAWLCLIMTFCIIILIFYIMNFIYTCIHRSRKQCTYIHIYIHIAWIFWYIMTFIEMQLYYTNSLMFCFFILHYTVILPCNTTLFNFIATWHFVVWVYHILLIYSTLDGHLEYSDYGAITNRFILNIPVHVSCYKCIWGHLGSTLWVDQRVYAFIQNYYVIQKPQWLYCLHSHQQCIRIPVHILSNVRFLNVFPGEFIIFHLSFILHVSDY